MLVLLLFSAFFSFSEAALFSLNQSDKTELNERGKNGARLQQLLYQPEKVLNSILLGNLFVNILFFTLASILAFRLKDHSGLAFGIGFGSLLAIILFAEIIPKNISVRMPLFCSLLVCMPISLLVRLLRPLLPVFSFLNLLSRRAVYPNFTPEPYLRVSDLERAVVLSDNDAALLKREQRALQSIVALSDMGAAEMMIPRSWLKTFRPPITFEQVLKEIAGTLPRSGYCLMTEPDSDEIVSALCLTRLTADNLENHWNEQFEDVIYVPWSVPVADVFDRFQRSGLSVAVVVNEFGETIGIITMDDIITTLFTRERGRSLGLLNRRELKLIDKNRWHLTGLTSVRTLERRFHVSLREYSSLTVGGLIREILERLPRVGDRCQVANLHFSVVDFDEESGIVVELNVL